MAFGINGISVVASDALNILGLANWQLQTASFNGVQFMVATNESININQIPFSGIYESINSFVTPSSVPFGTHKSTLRAQDQAKRRLVIHDIPGRDGNFMEDMGWESETFTFDIIFFGIGYQVLMQQFLRYCTNDALVKKDSDRNVLVHPTRGVFPNTKLASYQIIHEAPTARAARISATFISDNPPYRRSTVGAGYSSLYETINQVLTLSSEIASALQLTSLMFSGSPLGVGGGLGASQVVANGDTDSINPLIRSYVDTLDTANSTLSTLLQSSAKLVYNLLSPASFSDFSMNQITVDYDLLPELFRYATILTEDEISSLIDNYVSYVNTTIELYGTYDLDLVYADRINTFKDSVAQLTQFCQYFLQQSIANTVYYTVPYAMSLRMACFLNGIDFNQDITQIILNNRAVMVSVNYIEKDTVLILKAPDVTT